MRFNTEPWAKRKERRRLMCPDTWIPWFAWYPVKIGARYGDGPKVWLEVVEYHQEFPWDFPEYRIKG